MEAPTGRNRGGRHRGSVLTLRLCADCGQTATVTLGTTDLCQGCKWRVQAAILTRRPDLRAHPTGIGYPRGPALYDGGAPELRCDGCGAGWWGTPFMPCPWCVERPELDRQIQESIDQGRLRDYLVDIADGNDAAIVAAAHLLEVAVPRGTLKGADLVRFRRTVEKVA